MIRLLRLNLEPEGYEVLEAADGEEAYQIAIEKIPDVLLLDVMVPKKSGIEVCKSIKANPDAKQIPIILITGRGEGMRKAAMESGADLFLTKPFSPLRLLAEIRRMAENRRD
jgi:DNA-binding response OmpR family regulator